MARKTKLTPELQEKICDKIAHGNTFDRACRLCGISTSAFRSWRARGESAKSGKYAAFLAATKEAEERFIETHVGNIEKEAKSGTWQASAWLLERKYAEEFGRKHLMEHTGAAGGPIPIELVAPGTLEEEDKDDKD